MYPISINCVIKENGIRAEAGKNKYFLSPNMKLFKLSLGWTENSLVHFQIVKSTYLMVNFTLTFFVNTPSAINDSLDKSSKFAYVFSNIL